MPNKWHELYKLLPNAQQQGASWEPALPLILAAWWDTPHLSKIIRLREHLEWADDHGAIFLVDSFLRSLPEDQWYHANDLSGGGSSNEKGDCQMGKLFRSVFVLMCVTFSSPVALT
jgi:hypothetical protein